MAIFIQIFWVIAVIPLTQEVGKDLQILNESAERAELLQILEEAPEKLNLTDTGRLETIEKLRREAETNFSPDLVIDVAQTFQQNLDTAGRYREAIEILSELQNTFSAILRPAQSYWLTIKIAGFNNRLSNHGEVINQLKPILPEIQDLFTRGEALATLGVANNQLGMYDTAAGHYYEAIEAYRESDRNDRVAEVFNRLGNLYYYVEEYETSIKYYQQHLETAEELEDLKMLGNGYVNIGAAYRAAGDKNEALTYYQKGVELAVQTGNVLDLARVNMNIANLYAELEEFDKALGYYRESLAISEENGLEYGTLINQFNIGNMMFDMGRLEDSEEAYLAAYDRMSRENHKHEMLRLTQKLSELYELTGEYEKALSFLNLFTEVSSEIFDSEKLKIAEDLRVEYETELKEQELILADAIIKQKSAQSRFLWLFIVCLVLVLFVGTVYYRKRNNYLRELYSRNLEIVKTLGIDLDDKKRENGDTGQQSSRNNMYLQIRPLLMEKKIYRDSDLSLSKVAERVGSNRRYVSDAIKEATNMNFNSYINFYRINEAKKRIVEGEDSISEIHHACGFNSRTTFYTAFKKFTGMTPSEFRKISRQKREKRSKSSA